MPPGISKLKSCKGLDPSKQSGPDYSNGAPLGWNKTYDDQLAKSINSNTIPSGDALKDQARLPGVKDILLNDKLGPPKDINKICPSWTKLNDNQKVQVYQVLAQAIANPESNKDPRSFWHEAGRSDRDGYSVGLLQLSTEDNWRWGCHFTNPDPCAPTSPSESMDCFAEVMAVQVAMCGTIFQGDSDDPNGNGCKGQTAYKCGPDDPFYFSSLDYKKYANPKAPNSGQMVPNTGPNDGLGKMMSAWKQLTGWDIQSHKKVGAGTRIGFCYN